MAFILASAPDGSYRYQGRFLRMQEHPFVVKKLVDNFGRDAPQHLFWKHRGAAFGSRFSDVYIHAVVKVGSRLL